MQLLSSINHLLYPHVCLACGSDLLERNEFICLKCFHELPYTFYNQFRGNKTERIFYGRVSIDFATSLLYFSKGSIVQSLIHELKYKGQKKLGVYLGKLIGKRLKEASCFDDIGMIIPLPLHAQKLQKRGYNQAGLLCEGISSEINTPIAANNVIRIINTDTQTRKHRQERWQNVQGIFGVTDPVALQHKHVLLVDDVITTGSTLEACAKTLLQSVPSIRISIATLAIATT